MSFVILGVTLFVLLLVVNGKVRKDGPFGRWLCALFSAVAAVHAGEMAYRQAKRQREAMMRAQFANGGKVPQHTGEGK